MFSEILKNLKKIILLLSFNMYHTFFVLYFHIFIGKMAAFGYYFHFNWCANLLVPLVEVGVVFMRMRSGVY